jgi:hypothetical protein
MRPFLRRLGAALAIQALVLLGLLAFHFWWGADSDHYLAAWGDKRQRLEATPSPRVVLVGGSNLAMGIDSPALEHALGRPVVNLGLHGGFGMEFMLREAETACGVGDVIVLSIEYGLLFGRRPDTTALDLLELYPSAIRFLAWDALPMALDRGLGYVAKLPKVLVHYLTVGTRRPPEEIYSRRGFNAQGDLTAHWERVPPRPLPLGIGGAESPAVPPDALAPAVSRLNRFAAGCVARGARVVWAAPPLPEDEVRRWRAQLDSLEGALRRHLAVSVLVGMSDASYPERLFFDTAKHLTREGARLRTDTLASRLVPILPR